MSRTVTLSQFMPYGAPELQSVARPYMARALLLSVTLGTLLFVALGLLRGVLPDVGPSARPRVFTIDPYRPFHPPIAPSIVPRVAPTVARGGAKTGEVIPVPDVEAPPDNTIAPQEAMRSDPGVGTEESTTLVVTDPVDEPLPAPDEYRYVEEMPEPVKRVQPVYPELAREAGVAGRVVVLLLVGRDGRVLEVRVDESRHVMMLDAAALEAARQWVFKPALANRKPVAVWVRVPFDFRLQ